MLCYMHEGEPYGHLSLNGKQITPPVLARMVGESPTRVKQWLAELEAAGVPGKTDEGTYFCRRMVRDEHNRNVRAAGGALSLGKPNVPQPKNRRIPSTHPLPGSIGVSPASASASAEEPPNPPSVEGGPRLTRAERKRAEDIRKTSRYGCTHEPQCPDYESCIVEIALALRERVSA